MMVNLMVSDQELEIAQSICKGDGTDLDSFLTHIVKDLIAQKESEMKKEELVHELNLGFQQFLEGKVTPAEEFLVQLREKYE